jgi:predicted Zn-dependent protease
MRRNSFSEVVSAPARLYDRDGTMLQNESADEAILDRGDAQALIERIKKFSKAEAVEVQIFGGNVTNVRFADNQMSTAGGVSDFQVGVQSYFGAKHAVVTSNEVTDEALKAMVEKSEKLARLAPDDPESMPQLPPQQYQPVEAYFPSVANMTAEERAKIALTALEPCRAAGDLTAAGYLENRAGFTAYGTSTGLFAYHRGTSSNYTITARTKDGTGSGWAGAEHNDARLVDYAAVSRRAIEKARASRSPVAVEPGRYTVIMEPQAVGDLCQLIGFYADARATDEGRSPFVKQGGGTKIGEKILDERISIYADPFDPMGVQPTGAPTSFLMSGGTASVEDMIKATPRGILVTRLWYLREVDPRTILYTGLTRDGTFLIENGKITKAVKNFRFNDSPLFMLNNLEMLGRPERLAGTEAGGAVVVPAIKVKDFNFTSLSDAI